MIKLCIEDKTLAELDPALLPFVQWSSLQISDLDGVSEEIITANFLKLKPVVIKSALKKNLINLSNITDKDWYDLIDKANDYGINLPAIVQLPYSVIATVLMGQSARHRSMATSIALYQKNTPMVDAVRFLQSYDINNVLLTNINPGLRDFMFTPEGIELVRKHHGVGNFTMVTSTEAKLLGNSIDNVKISGTILGRADACDAGRNYFTRTLRELGKAEITWDEAIELIRTHPVLQKREQLVSYMQWINQHRRVIKRYA